MFDVLAYLVSSRPAMVSKNELLDNVWGGRFVSDASLSGCIAAARRAVRTVHSKGFIFVAETD